MPDVYDVVIIGAGPAGAACANILKNTHLSILLIDKNINSYSKPCAGVLTENVSVFYYPKENVREFRKIKLKINDRMYIKRVNSIKTVSRKKFFFHMLDKLRKAPNITVREDEIKKITPYAVYSKSGEQTGFRNLVGADGSMSIVRRFLKLKTRFMIGIYFEFPFVLEDLEKIFDSYKAECEYIWVFPHNDHTNIGMGFNPEKIKMKQAKQVFFQFLSENNYDFSHLRLHSAPLNYSFKGCVFNNIYLAGDAAGLIIKISGEGIPQAIISGEEIGWKILHPDYRLKRLRIMTGEIRRLNFLYNVFHRFPFCFRFL